MIEKYYNTKDLIFVTKRRHKMKNGKLINEGWDNDKDIVPGFPVNKPIKFNEAMMVKAIQNGMVILINYAGY